MIVDTLILIKAMGQRRRFGNPFRGLSANSSIGAQRLAARRLTTGRVSGSTEMAIEENDLWPTPDSGVGGGAGGNSHSHSELSRLSNPLPGMRHPSTDESSEDGGGYHTNAVRCVSVNVPLLPEFQ